MSSELHSEEILKLEFGYARDTAQQAQNDRTVIVNLYVLLVGGIGSLLLAATTLGAGRIVIPPQGLSLLFLVLGILGALTLFKLIRLRQAWLDSVRAMNAIKDYYLQAFPELDAAFVWKTKTIPSSNKTWTITFILSMMVMILSSISFAAALHFADWQSGGTLLLLEGIVFGFVLGAEILFYFFQLRPARENRNDEPE